jgi:hypothetical protein
VNIVELEKAIRRVIHKHARAFRAIGSSQPKLLELASITGLAHHYKVNGYKITIDNPPGETDFVVKTSTRGYPWNFSRIVASNRRNKFELHMNVLVRSAHDKGIYCVDVGVVSANSVPSTKPRRRWQCVDNVDLLTFAESKKLVIYPMLLAQFIGIVHEIKPDYVRMSGTFKGPHLPPVLISLGHFSGNSLAIIRSYRKRGIRVKVAENYDMRLARVRRGSAKSPFH